MTPRWARLTGLIRQNRPYTCIFLNATNGTKVAGPFLKRGMSVMRILIEKADWVVTVDANRRLLQSASILIENDRIAFVGPARDLSPDVDVDRRIDGGGL